MFPKRQAYVNMEKESAVWFLGALTRVMSTGENTNGAFGLIEQLIPAGFASPYHIHHLEDEAFYVLEGGVTFVCDGEWFKAGPGAYVYGPREIPHGFRIEGSTPARILLLCAPAGFERFVIEMSDPATERTLPPPAPPDMAKLMALAAKYNIDILGPLPEYAGVFKSEVKSDNEIIEDVRAAHVAALNNRDAEAWVGVFAEDAVQMPPNAPANVGKASIRSWAESFLHEFTVNFALLVTELQIAGNRAFESGGYTITLIPETGGQAIQDVGKYITIYQRLPTGSWAVARDIWNSDQPLPGMH
jgi:uncharacterized protein (TIGR02246 family)